MQYIRFNARNRIKRSTKSLEIGEKAKEKFKIKSSFHISLSGVEKAKKNVSCAFPFAGTLSVGAFFI